MPEVKQERSGWRDLRLSQRHRDWGYDCPCVDIDFLAVEYDKGKAIAIVEYKHELAAVQLSSHPSYRAIIDLGNRAQCPVFAVRYSDDFTSWKVVPLNATAKEYLPERKTMTEREWVAFLYHIRGYEMPDGLFEMKDITV